MLQEDITFGLMISKRKLKNRKSEQGVSLDRENVGGAARITYGLGK